MTRRRRMRRRRMKRKVYSGGGEGSGGGGIVSHGYCKRDLLEESKRPRYGHRC